MDLPNLDPGVWLIIIVAILLTMAGGSKSRAKGGESAGTERRRVTIETIDAKTGMVLRTEVGLAIETPTATGARASGPIGSAARAPHKGRSSDDPFARLRV
jgi:hypothetical protein